MRQSTSPRLFEASSPSKRRATRPRVARFTPELVGPDGRPFACRLSHCADRVHGPEWLGYTCGRRTGQTSWEFDVTVVRTVLELFTYLVHRKVWWMIPVVAGLLMVGLLIIVAEATPLGPFIYSLI